MLEGVLYMIIRLQPDQIVLFWDMIRKSMIESNKVPKEFQQDYAINVLTKFLSGMLQAWVGYKVDEEGVKKLHTVFASSIVDEKHHGVRILNAEAIYGFRLIDEELLIEIYIKMEEFAKANNCTVLSADYSFNRVKDILLSAGFEEHKTICRKFI